MFSGPKLLPITETQSKAKIFIYIYYSLTNPTIGSRLFFLAKFCKSVKPLTSIGLSLPKLAHEARLVGGTFVQKKVLHRIL